MKKSPPKSHDSDGPMVRVAGFEPTASWSRRFARKFKGRFRTHLVLFVPRADAFWISPLQCLRPLPAWYGSAFGSGFGADCTDGGEISHRLDALPIIVRAENYPDVQTFTETCRRTEAVVGQYNRELTEWGWKMQEHQRPARSDPSRSQRSVREQLRRLQAEGRRVAATQEVR